MKNKEKQNKLHLFKFKIAKLSKFGKRVVIGGNGGNEDGEEVTHTVKPSKFCYTVD